MVRRHEVETQHLRGGDDDPVTGIGVDDAVDRRHPTSDGGVDRENGDSGSSSTP